MRRRNTSERQTYGCERETEGSGEGKPERKDGETTYRPSRTMGLFQWGSMMKGKMRGKRIDEGEVSVWLPRTARRTGTRLNQCQTCCCSLAKSNQMQSFGCGEHMEAIAHNVQGLITKLHVSMSTYAFVCVHMCPWFTCKICMCMRRECVRECVRVWWKGGASNRGPSSPDLKRHSFITANLPNINMRASKQSLSEGQRGDPPMTGDEGPHECRTVRAPGPSLCLC